MQLTISGHHLEITEAIESAVREKFAKVQRHYPDLDAINVILTVEKHEHMAEVNSHFLGMDLAAIGRSQDLYQSIADVSSKFEVVLGKRKSTVKSHLHDKQSLRDQSLENSSDDNDDSDDDIQESTG